MQQQTDIAQLLGAKQRDDSGSGMGDMGAQQMAIGSKMASASLNSAIKKFAKRAAETMYCSRCKDPYPCGVKAHEQEIEGQRAKSAAPIHSFFDDLREGSPNDSYRNFRKMRHEESLLAARQRIALGQSKLFDTKGELLPTPRSIPAGIASLRGSALSSLKGLTGRGLLAGVPGALGSLGGYHLVDSLLGKRAAQADTSHRSPERSEVGGSKGLSAREDPGAYAQGQSAWESVRDYFKGGRRLKQQPNPFTGEHRGKEALDTVIGVKTATLGAPLPAMPARMPAAAQAPLHPGPSEGGVLRPVQQGPKPLSGDGTVGGTLPPKMGGAVGSLGRMVGYLTGRAPVAGVGSSADAAAPR